MSHKPGLFQRLYRALVARERFAEVEAETRKWSAACKRCGENFDAWSTGAVFWRKPDENGGLVKCPHCRGRTTAFFKRQPD